MTLSVRFLLEALLHPSYRSHLESVAHLLLTSFGFSSQQPFVRAQGVRPDDHRPSIMLCFRGLSRTQVGFQRLELQAVQREAEQ